MPARPTAARAARWMTRDSELTAELADEIIWQIAWLTAARSGQYARRETVWADGDPSTVECCAGGLWIAQAPASRAAEAERAAD